MSRLYKNPIWNCVLYMVLLGLSAIKSSVDLLVGKLQNYYFHRKYYDNILDKIKPAHIRRSEIPTGWKPMSMFYMLTVALVIGGITCFALMFFGFWIIYIEYPLNKKLNEEEKMLKNTLVKVIHSILGFQSVCLIIFFATANFLKKLERLELKHEIWRRRIVALLQYEENIIINDTFII